MLDFQTLFFGFSGRIGRQSWWIGMILIGLASVVGTWLVDPSTFDFEVRDHTPNLSNTLWQVALQIPTTALFVKRFNDRDMPEWLGYAYGILGALLAVAEHFSLLKPDGNVIGTILIGVAALLFIYLLIDNGFLRGTQGPNRYGPDPLATTGA